MSDSELNVPAEAISQRPSIWAWMRARKGLLVGIVQLGGTAVLASLVWPSVNGRDVGFFFAHLSLERGLVLGICLFVGLGFATLRWLAWLEEETLRSISVARFFWQLRHFIFSGLLAMVLPAGVADVYRGVKTYQRSASVGRALGGTFLERGLGLSAVLLLAGGWGVFGSRALAWVWVMLFVGGVSCVAIYAVFVKNPVAAFVRVRLQRAPSFVPWAAHLARLPTFRPRTFWAALGFSALYQLAANLFSLVLLRTVAPGASIGDSLCVFNLLSVATYVPLSVNGLGLREAVLARFADVMMVSQSQAIAFGILNYTATLLLVVIFWTALTVAARLGLARTFAGNDHAAGAEGSEA